MGGVGGRGAAGRDVTVSVEQDRANSCSGGKEEGYALNVRHHCVHYNKHTHLSPPS